MDLIIYLRVLLFCFMLYGYFSFALRILKIEIYFVPIFVCSMIGIIIYFSGLLGIMYYATYTIAAIGLCLGTYSLYLKKKDGMDIPNITLFQTGFVIGTFFFMKLLLERKFIHYDNFTHWGLVVKEMLITNAFPTADSVIIEFTNYPLGSSSFVYFVCRLISNDQGIMLFAQGIIVFSCFYGMYAIIEQKRRFLLIIVLTTGFSLLSYFNLTVRIDNLLVDFILATMTLVILSCVYCYHDRLNTMLFVSTPLIAFLLILKSTGIFYACIIYLYMFYICFQYRKTNTKYIIIYMGDYVVSKNNSSTLFFSKILLAIGCASSTILCWNYHVNTVFAEVEHKFDVSTSDALNFYGDKSKEQIAQILSLFKYTLFDISNRSSLGLLLFEIIGLLMCIIGAVFFPKKWKSALIFITTNIILITYITGILLLYILIMPYEEASYLAGYERYISTIVIVALGVLWMNLTINMENSFHYRLGEVSDYKAFKSIQTKKYYSNGMIICGLLIFFVLSSEYNGILYNHLWYPNSIVSKIDELVEESWDDVDTETKYLLYASNEEEQVSSYYVTYIAKYYLYASNVSAISTCNDEMLDQISQYDYFIIVEQDDAIEALMMELFQCHGDVGVYVVDDLLDSVTVG